MAHAGAQQPDVPVHPATAIEVLRRTAAIWAAAPNHVSSQRAPTLWRHAFSHEASTCMSARLHTGHNAAAATNATRQVRAAGLRGPLCGDLDLCLVQGDETTPSRPAPPLRCVPRRGPPGRASRRLGSCARCRDRGGSAPTNCSPAAGPKGCEPSTRHAAGPATGRLFGRFLQLDICRIERVARSPCMATTLRARRSPSVATWSPYPAAAASVPAQARGPPHRRLPRLRLRPVSEPSRASAGFW